MVVVACGDSITERLEGCSAVHVDEIAPTGVVAVASVDVIDEPENRGVFGDFRVVFEERDLRVDVVLDEPVDACCGIIDRLLDCGEAVFDDGFECVDASLDAWRERRVVSFDGIQCGGNGATAGVSDDGRGFSLGVVEGIEDVAGHGAVVWVAR